MSTRFFAGLFVLTWVLDPAFAQEEEENAGGRAKVAVVGVQESPGVGLVFSRHRSFRPWNPSESSASP